MVAAVPIVAAVAGTASAVSSISAQKKNARQQANALESQIANSETNTALRLIEIERQRAFAQMQSTINDMSRQNALQVRRAQDQLQEAQIDLQRAQIEQNADIANQMATQSELSQQGQINQSRLNTRLGTQLANNQSLLQQDMANANIRTQAGLQRNNVNAQRDLAQLRNQGQFNMANVSTDANQAFGNTNARVAFQLANQQAGNQFTQADTQRQVQEAQGLLTTEQQRAGEILGAQQQYLAAEQQANQVLDQLANEFQDAERQQTNQLRQQAITQAQLRAQSGGGQSLSDAALLGDVEAQLGQDFMTQASRSSDTVGRIENDLDLQQALRDYSITDAKNRAELGRENIPLQSRLQRISLLQGLDDAQTQARIQQDTALRGNNLTAALNRRQANLSRRLGNEQADVQRQLAMQGINANQQLNLQNANVQRALERQGILVNNLSQRQQQDLQQELLNNSAVQQNILREMQTAEQWNTNMIDRNANLIQRRAGETSGELQRELGLLQSRFSDVALQSSGLSTQLAGQAELAALANQRANIQSPGALGTLGALTQGAASIVNALPRGNPGTAAPVNPLYGQQQQPGLSLFRGGTTIPQNSNFGNTDYSFLSGGFN